MNHNESQRPRPPGDADDIHGTGTAAIVEPWLRLREQLTPLIGENGFSALFGRALRLSTVRFACLGGCSSTGSVADLLMSLTRTLNEIGSEHAAQANGELLGTFTTLLGNLIGEALTQQLLYVADEGADGQKHDRSRSK